jgi:hypothetical protein
MTNNPRTPAAQRMRLHRERRRRGLRCLMIELRETDVDALIRGGLLEHGTRNDRNAVLKALYGHFNRTLASATVTRNSAIDDCQSNT